MVDTWLSERTLTASRTCPLTRHQCTSWVEVEVYMTRPCPHATPPPPHSKSVTMVRRSLGSLSFNTNTDVTPVTLETGLPPNRAFQGQAPPEGHEQTSYSSCFHIQRAPYNHHIVTPSALAGKTGDVSLLKTYNGCLCTTRIQGDGGERPATNPHPYTMASTVHLSKTPSEHLGFLIVFCTG